MLEVVQPMSDDLGIAPFQPRHLALALTVRTELTIPRCERCDGMTKLQCVARALAKEFGSDDWPAFVEPARAAIRALREPTPAMLDAAVPGLPIWDELHDDWQKMIDNVAEEQVFPAAL
jgi:hypothetical protein